MGSVKLKDLKAFVRYDGSGRVVSGSLVFRKKKPKNGRWVEIPKNLCCNENPSSTTTSTTQGGGSTVTMYSIIDSSSLEFVCEGVPGWLVYAAQSTLGVGVTLYYDAALTQPWEGQQYISHEGIVYTLSGATIIDNGTPCGNTTTTTTTVAQVYYYSADYYYNCNLDQSGVTVVSSVPLSNGTYYTDPGSSCTTFLITGSAFEDPLAYQVDPNSASPVCTGC